MLCWPEERLGRIEMSLLDIVGFLLLISVFLVVVTDGGRQPVGYLIPKGIQ